MYGPLWRALPGPWWVKTLIVLVLVLAIVAVLFMWVFPIVALYMPFTTTPWVRRCRCRSAEAAPEATAPAAASPRRQGRLVDLFGLFRAQIPECAEGTAAADGFSR